MRFGASFRLRPGPVTLAIALVAGIAPHAKVARAQDNAAAVEALFSAGKKLMADGRVAEACPKFLASYNLEHRIGTVLNLADCYEKNGQLASAWARFVEARTLATRANQPERVTFASDHAKALEPRLSNLTLTVAAPVAGLVVARDGVTVDPGAYGVAVAIDGGPHEITASAPGMRTWTGHVTVQQSGDHQSLTIPALEPMPVAAAAPPPEMSKGVKYGAIAAAGVGVVGIGIGAVFGVMAIGKNHDSAPFCGMGSADGCTQQGVDLRSTAVSDGTLSTVFIGVGAAALVGGGVLWLVGRPSTPAGTTVGFDGRSVMLSGRF
jgi:hypothetical protein